MTMSLRIAASWRSSYLPEPAWPTIAMCYPSLKKILEILNKSLRPVGMSRRN